MQTKVTVVGGSGFIGSYLINQLNTKYSIINIDKNAEKNDIKCDIRSVDDLISKIPTSEWIVNLAAEHKDNVSPISLYYDVNVEGTRNLLKAMDSKGIKKIIFTSSVAVYGLDKNNPDEDHPVDPFNHYGISKYQGEEVLREWYNQNPQEKTLVIIRPTVVFGPKNKGNVYNLLQQILKGSFKMVGKGENIKSMSYVGNIAAFIEYILEKNPNGYHLYNYVDKPDMNTNQLIQAISKVAGITLSPIRIPYYIGYLAGLGFDVLSKITGKEFSISSIRIKKFCSTTQFSNKKIQSTDFKAPFSLEEGLETTIKSLL